MNTHHTITRRLTTLALIALATIPLTVSAVISGTKHDFSGKLWGSTEICIFCHTPHDAKAATNGPLWNHAPTATATFTLYANTSGSLNAIPGQPGSISKACLSCHDGTVAPDSYGTRVGTAPMLTGAVLIGADLSNDHPISFTYDTALATADGQLVAPNSTSSVDVAKTLPLFVGKMECATCHDAHGGITGTKLLRKTNAASALCLACHVK